jgi:hypothetical protein
VDVWLDDQHLGQARCDGYRQDVCDAGYGNGLSGFTYCFPPTSRPTPGAQVKVFVSGTTILVGGSVVTPAA